MENENIFFNNEKHEKARKFFRGFSCFSLFTPLPVSYYDFLLRIKYDFLGFFPTEARIGNGNIREDGAFFQQLLISCFQVAFQHYAGQRGCSRAVLFDQGLENHFLSLDVFAGISMAAIDEKSLPQSCFNQFSLCIFEVFRGVIWTIAAASEDKVAERISLGAKDPVWPLRITPMKPCGAATVVRFSMFSRSHPYHF